MYQGNSNMTLHKKKYISDTNKPGNQASLSHVHGPLHYYGVWQTELDSELGESISS